MGDFVHLHLHSEYSLLDGACRISEIPEAAKAQGHSAVAITDHGNMYGAVRFYKACRAAGIKPIIGSEMYVAGTSIADRTKSAENGIYHLILLAKDLTGWKNLIYLSSASFTDGFYIKPRIDYELLKDHAEGLVCLSACVSGYIPRCILNGDSERAREYALKLDSLFGRGNFYLEIQDHGLREESIVRNGILEISRETGIPMVCTNDVHYLRKADADYQDTLMCIQTGKQKDELNRMRFDSDEYYYKSTAEMEQLFSEYGDAAANTARIAAMCDLELEFGSTKLPRYSPDDGSTPEEFLRKLVRRGLGRKIAESKITFDGEHDETVYNERIDYEFSVISQMGYVEYYLVVWDFVNYARSSGIPVGPGRGSGAGSLIAYLIGITDVDPIRFDLLFERFLNPERVSMPDFDIDFCYNRRDEVIEYVRVKYGADRTSQIITFGTLAAKAAIRAVGRTMGMPYSDVDRVAKLVPGDLGITLKEAIERVPELKALQNDKQTGRLIATSLAIEGLPRNASVHAAGVVITEKPLCEYVPVAVNNGITVTQFDMDTIAELGLLKFDFLALRYLTVINEAERLIREKEPGFDVTRADMKDRLTYETISRGDTNGVFQLESRGMRQMLTQLKPESIEDVIAAIALFRPGPMDSIPRYIEARHGISKPEYSIPALRTILESTYGCIVYQEQVMQIFREVSGYSFGHADVVRRAISKKKKEVIDGERRTFIDGAVAKGTPEKEAEDLFESIVSFANYAFNKSHAAAYAVLSFRTAYLKSHYPLEYMSAYLTSVLTDNSKLAEYIADLKSRGITVLPPDINRSYPGFRPDGDAVRFALGAIKGIGSGLCERIVEDRERNGEFSGIEDFAARISGTGMSVMQFEEMVKAGVFDSLGVYRSRLMAASKQLMDKKVFGKRDDSQISLFDSVAAEDMPQKSSVEFPDIPEFDLNRKLQLEKEAAGVSLSGHILDEYANFFRSPDVLPLATLSLSAPDEEEDADDRLMKLADTRVRAGGVVAMRNDKATKKGDMMSFIALEDMSGTAEVICFPRILEKYGALLTEGRAVEIRGRISVKEDEAGKIIAESVTELGKDGETVPDPPRQDPGEHMTERPREDGAKLRKAYLRVPGKDSPGYRRASAFLDIFTGKDLAVFFYYADTGEYVPYGNGMKDTEFARCELREILGPDNVVIK